MSNDYTSPNTKPNTLMTLTLTLTDPHNACVSFCAPVFCDFVRNYSCTVDGAVVTSIRICVSVIVSMIFRKSVSMSVWMNISMVPAWISTCI